MGQYSLEDEARLAVFPGAASPPRGAMDWSIPSANWEQWYESLDGGGEDARLHQRFVQELDQILERPIQVGDQAYTPTQIMQARLDGDEMIRHPDDEELKQAIMQNARSSLAGLPGVENRFGITPQSLVVRDTVDTVIQVMTDSAAGGAEQPFTPVTESQHRQWMQEDGFNTGRFRVNDGTAESLQRLRDANLMRTFQSGQSAPAYANLPGMILGGAGAAAAGLSRAWNTGHYLEPDTLEVMAMGGRSPVPTPAGRLRESMYWWDQGRPTPTNSSHYKDPVMGAKFPQYSATTMQGVGNTFTKNENTLAAAINHPFRMFYQNITNPSDVPTLDAIGQNLERVQPIVSDTADPAEASQLQEMYRDRASRNEGWASAQKPRLTRMANEMLGTSFEPAYMSPAAEFAVNFPRYVAEDAFTTAGLLSGGAKAAATGAVRSLSTNSIRPLLAQLGKFGGRQAANIAGEMPREGAVENMINPPSSSPFSPSPFNSFMIDKMGSPISAKDPQYEFKYGQVQDQMDRDMDTMRQLQRKVLPATSRPSMPTMRIGPGGIPE